MNGKGIDKQFLLLAGVFIISAGFIWFQSNNIIAKIVGWLLIIGIFYYLPFLFLTFFYQMIWRENKVTWKAIILIFVLSVSLGTWTMFILRDTVVNTFSGRTVVAQSTSPDKSKKLIIEQTHWLDTMTYFFVQSSWLKKKTRISPHYFPLSSFEQELTMEEFSLSPSTRQTIEVNWDKNSQSFVVWVGDPQAIPYETFYPYCAYDFQKGVQEFSFLEPYQRLLGSASIDKIDLAQRIVAEKKEYVQGLFLAAALEGDLELVRELVSLGIPANGFVSRLKLSIVGRNPLELAAFKGHSEVVGFLLEREGGINNLEAWLKKKLFETVMRQGDVEVLKVLLKDVADVDQWRDDYLSRTLLMLAAKEGHTDMVTYLLDRGADPSIKDEEGKTALDMVNHKNRALIEILEKAATVDREHRGTVDLP